MNHKKFLYFLLDNQNRCYQLQNGVIAPSAKLTPLDQTPDGWQEILVGFERDMDKGGIVTAFSFPLGFVGDGARFLRHIALSKNIEEETFLYITRFRLDIDADRFYPKYHPFYKSLVDLSTIQTDDIGKTTVKLADKSLNALLKSAGGTTHEFTLSGSDAVIVKHDGLELTESRNYLFPENGGAWGQHQPPLYFTSNEGAAAGTASFNQQGQSGWPTFGTSEDYFFSASQEIASIQISGKIKTASLVDYYKLYVKSSKGQSVLLIDGTGTGVKEFDIEGTFASTGDEKFFLVAECGNNSFFFLVYQESEIKLTFKSRYKTTYIKGFPLPVLFRKLIARITGKEGLAVSTLLDQYAHIIVTSGDGMRGIVGAKLKTSFNALFDHLKAVYGAAVGVESGKVTLEKRLYFFDAANPIPLGEVSGLKWSIATELLANTVKVGYAEKKIDDVNGKLSFNNTHLYNSPMTKGKELSLISPWVADPYVIELTRINLEGKTTTDGSNDNEVMVLDCKSETITFTASVTAGTSPLPHLIIEGAEAYQANFVTGFKFTLSGMPTLNRTFTVKSITVDPVAGMLVLTEETPIEETGTATISFGSYTLNRDGYTVTGIPATSSVFNVGMTPKRCLLAHMDYLNAIFNGFAGRKLTFQTTERNDALTSTLNGVTVTEKADQEIGAARLFLPIVFEFDANTPYNLAELLDENPNRPFSFEWDGVTYTGFLLKAGISPNDLKPQAFKLLAAPTNDLSTLI